MEEPVAGEVLEDSVAEQRHVLTEHERVTEPVLPQRLSDGALLQHEGEELVDEEVGGERGPDDRLHIACAPQSGQPRRRPQRLLARGEEQQVADGPGPPAGAATTTRSPERRSG